MRIDKKLSLALVIVLCLSLTSLASATTYFTYNNDTDFNSTTLDDFLGYSYRREGLNVVSGLMTPYTQEDPDLDGSNSVYYMLGNGSYVCSTFQNGVKAQECIGTAPSSLKDYWPLDNDNAKDISGNGNDGTLNNGVTTGATGQVKNAYDFDGTDDYVEVADDPSLQISENFSISAWINASDRSGVPQTILSKTKYALKEYDDDYIFEIIGDNSAATWGTNLSVGVGPRGLAVYDGKLYVTNYGSDDVYVFDGTSWSISGSVGTDPRGLAVYDGKLYAANSGSDDVYVFDGTSWSLSGSVGTTPYGLATYDGKLYVTNLGSDDVYVFNGTSWSLSGGVGTAPMGLATYDGKLYVTNYGSDDIYVFDGSSWSISGSVGTSPRGLAVYDGKLYVTNADSDDVYVFNGTSWSLSGGVGTTPMGLAVYDGKLYVTNLDSDDVYVFDGTSWSISGSVGTSPRGLAVYDGKLYVTILGSDDVWEYGNGKSIWMAKGTGYDHLSATISSSELKFSRDGSLQTKESYSFPLASGSSPLRIGKGWGSTQSGFYGGNNEHFKGTIDDVRIYDRALSSSEISALYNATKPVPGNDPTFGSEQTALNAPINPSPSDGAAITTDSPTLSVDVSDANGDAMDVEFFVDTFDISSASYTQSFNVSGQDTGPATGPTGLTFNSDGSKMFIAGNSNDNVYEYSLSTPFDISTASYTQSLDVSGQDTDPRGLTFNSDGSKMFIAGDGYENVYEYDLSTPFDISTASYTQSLDVSGQDTAPTGLTFNSDGSKMFMGGAINDNVFEYSLSTPFDISTASYTQSLDVSGQDVSLLGLTFNSDGSKIFVAGASDDSVYEYSLSTPFDISTASYTQSLDVSGQDTTPTELTFNSDGSKMFIAGTSDENVYEYSVGESEVDTGVASGGTASVTLSGLADGSHSWYAVADDGTATVQSSTWSFTVDTTPPSVTITSPSDSTTFSTTSVTMTWSGNDNLGIDHYEIKKNSDTYTSVSTDTSYEFTGLSEGSHTLYVKAYDAAGNTNTDSITVYIDTTPPSVSLIRPDGNESKYNIPLNYIASDATSSLDTCWYSVDGETNKTLASCSNTTFDRTNVGGHSLSLYVNDTQGYVDSDSVNFDVYYTNVFKAKSERTNSSISNFKVILANDSTQTGGSTSDGTFEINTSDIPYGNVNITYKATNYDTETFDLGTVNSSSEFNETYALKTAGLTLNVYDEETENGIAYNATVNNKTTTMRLSNQEINNTNKAAYVDAGGGSENLTYTFKRYVNADNLSWKTSGSSGINDKIYIFYLDGSVQTDSTTFLISNENYPSVDGVITKIVFEVSDTISYDVEINSVKVVDEEKRGFQADYADLKTNGFPTGDVTVSVDNNEYKPRNYLIMLNEFSKIDLDTYLLKETKAVTQSIVVVDEEGNGVDDAKISIQKYIDGAWKTLSQKLSTGSGTNFFLNPETQYQLVVSKTGYVQATDNFYPSNYDELVVQLASVSDTDFKTMWDSISHKLEPLGNIIPPAYQTFNFTIYDDKAALGEIGLELYNNGTLLDKTNVTGSPSGTTISVAYNFSNYSYGEEVDATWYFERNGSIYNQTRMYTISEDMEPGNKSIIGILDDMGGTTSNATKGLVSLFITLGIATALGRRLKGFGGGIIVLLSIGFFTLIGWMGVPIFIVTLLGTIGVYLARG